MMFNKFLIALATSVVALLLLGLVMFNEQYMERTLHQSLEQSAERSYASFDALVQQSYANLLMVATLYAEEHHVRDLFRKGVEAVAEEGGGAGGEQAAYWRDQLYQHIGPSWMSAADKYQLRQLHFHMGPGSTSFLRVHRPEKFGDDLSRLRHIVVETNRSKEAYTGFETGRVYSGLRGVVPVIDRDEKSGKKIQLGALEAGTSYAHLLGILKEHLDVNVAVLLTKKHIQSTMWEQSIDQLFGGSELPCDCVLEATSNRGVGEILANHNHAIEGHQHLYQHSELIYSDDKVFSVSFFPLRDFLGQQNPEREAVGQIMVWTDITEKIIALDQQKHTYRLWAGVLFVALMLVLFFSVRRITGHLQNLVEGRTYALSNATENLEKVNRELLLAQDRVKGFANAASDWFWETDSEHRFSYFSSQLKPMTGLEPSALLGKRRDQIGFHGVEEEGIREHIQILQQHEPFRDFVYAVEDARGEHWLAINGDPIYSREGVFKGYRGTGRNITERVNQERAIEQHRQEVERSKDDFFASMSHELRTPLTAIIGNTQHLLDGGSCGQQQCQQSDAESVLHSIENAANNQLALVNDILDMSKIESGKFTIEEAPYDLALLLDHLQQMLLIKAKDAGLALQFEQSSDETHQLIGDVHRIQQILVNLLSNAIKFTEQGTVSLTTAVISGELCFTVQDSGIGISEEQVGQLFKRFEQADGSISKRFGGSGLGLYISKNLAEMMGGQIEVSSQEGTGSTFTLRLPYRQSELPVEKPRVETGNRPTLEVQLKGNVLIAEDTPELQLLERRILEGLGLTVSVADNGQEAVEKVKNSPFDLVLMDMQMPVMDGIEAARQIRQFNQQIPIVALTANVMQKHREQFETAGCNGFIEKPIDKRQLLQVLKVHLS